MMLTCCPNLMLLRDWRYIDFQIGYIADFEQVKVDVHSSNFRHVKTDPVCSVLLLWTCHSYFTEFG